MRLNLPKSILKADPKMPPVSEDSAIQHKRYSPPALEMYTTSQVSIDLFSINDVLDAGKRSMTNPVAHVSMTAKTSNKEM
jgi:hypothetical protein